MYPSFSNCIQAVRRNFAKACARDHINILSYHSSPCTEQAYAEDPIEFYAVKDNLISWTSKISSLVRKNQPKEAVVMFKSMLMSESRPNYVTLLSVIRAVGALNCESMMRVVHGLVIVMGFESEVLVLTALLGFYSNYNMGIVWKLFDGIPIKDVVLWSAVISACVKNEHYMEAIELLREMQYLGLKPNHVTIVSILPSCSNLRSLQFGRQIHGFSVKWAFHHLINVQNALMDLYAKCGNLETAFQIFDGVHRKDLISWRTVIRGCTENDCPRKALNTFLKMHGSCLKPGVAIIQEIIAASIQAEETKFGLLFHCLILKNGFLAFISARTALLQMYAKYGEVGSAGVLFDELNQKDLIAWSAMISLYAQHGQPHNALDTFKQMQSTNEKPNEITFVSLLQACTSVGIQELGESIHAHVTKAGYSLNAHLVSTLIDLYCKFGRVKQGKTLFDEIQTKDLVCWSSMIKGYGLNGYGVEALETFTNMLDCGVKPNDVIFISVLSACSLCGLEYEGRSWFHSMEEEYGITPKLAHYACMVDLLSRRGNVDEALGLVKKIPVKPDKRIWGSLLAGCRSAHGSIETAEFVVEQLILLDPRNMSYYEILLNLYAKEGRWENVERLQKLMDEKGQKIDLG